MEDTERHDRIRFSRLPELRSQRPATTLSFVVRLTVEPTGEVTGVVERVATGEKVRFVGCDGVSAVIATLLAKEKTAE